MRTSNARRSKVFIADDSDEVRNGGFFPSECLCALPLREAAEMMEEDTDVNMRLLVLVLNLERRHDRREWMERTLCVESGDKLGFVQACDGSVPALARHHHGFVFTPCADWALSASELGDLERRWTEELGYTAPDAGDLAEFYGRDLTAGEVACFATHHAAWVSAAPRLGVTALGAASAHMTRWQAASVGEEWAAVVLEDDVTVLPCEEPRLHVHAARWRSVWNALRAQLTALRERKLPWFMLILLHSYACAPLLSFHSLTSLSVRTKRDAGT